MKDGPHTNSLEQAGLQGKLLPRSDSIFSIWHYFTEPKCVGDQHFPVREGHGPAGHVHEPYQAPIIGAPLFGDASHTLQTGAETTKTTKQPTSALT